MHKNYTVTLHNCMPGTHGKKKVATSSRAEITHESESNYVPLRSKSKAPCLRCLIILLRLSSGEVAASRNWQPGVDTAGEALLSRDLLATTSILEFTSRRRKHSAHLFNQHTISIVTQRPFLSTSPLALKRNECKRISATSTAQFSVRAVARHTSASSNNT